MSEIDGGSGSHDPIVPHEGTLAAADSARSVFVSYASQNADFAKSLVEALEREQLSCWIAPRDVTPGALYADGIIRAITAAQVFVLVLSKSAIESKHVGKEVERASSKGLPVVTLRIDSAPLTPALEYFLSESQWIDVEPSRGDEAFTQVINALKPHLSADRIVRPYRQRRQPEWDPGSSNHRSTIALGCERRNRCS
jgi:hypothetical protein